MKRKAQKGGGGFIMGGYGFSMGPMVIGLWQPISSSKEEGRQQGDQGIFIREEMEEKRKWDWKIRKRKSKEVRSVRKGGDRGKEEENKK